jgi:hypothetical protein
MKGQPLFHGICGELKHSLVIICDSMGGDRITPFLVSSQVNDDVIRRLKMKGSESEMLSWSDAGINSP